jgi:hypothetical protein
MLGKTLITEMQPHAGNERRQPSLTVAYRVRMAARNMTIEEQIRYLTSRLVARNDAELARELYGLMNVFDDGNYREKIHDAVRWVEIYIDPQKAEAHGGQAVVLEFLVQELDTAADLAGTLQGNPP